MLRVETIVVTPFAQNARVIWDPATKNAVMIDPGGEAAKLLKFVRSQELNLEQIWLTHSHVDHVGGVAKVKAQTGAKLYGHRSEAPMRQAVLQICAMYGLPEGDAENCPEPDVFIEGGETLNLGAHDFKVFFTPGHSPGHVSFYQAAQGLLVSGDVLFSGSIGRTDLPGGDLDVLINSIEMLMKTLPPKTAVLSGHGPDTTLEVERRSNPFLQGA